MLFRSHNAFRQAFVTASFRRNVSIVLGLSSLTTPLISSCEDKSFIDKIIAKDRSGNIDWNASLDTVAVEAGKSIQGAIDSGYPTQLSYGFVMGYCSGYALKKVGKIAAVVLGEFQCVTTQNKTIVCVLALPDPAARSHPAARFHRQRHRRHLRDQIGRASCRERV